LDEVNKEKRELKSTLDKERREKSRFEKEMTEKLQVSFAFHFTKPCVGFRRKQ
jgi:hypothetical protein